MPNVIMMKKTNPENQLASIQEEISNLLLGKSETIKLAMSALLAGGHILLEGFPGTGKTTLAKLLAEAFQAKFQRVQMTSDLLPSDIIGTLRINPKSKEFEFRQGPVFCNFLLADELNRTGPKTQGALLEAMAEGTVSVDGKSNKLPSPFFVIATQNPHESYGVYSLPESQLDRFMMHLTLDYPSAEDEMKIYTNKNQENYSETLREPLDIDFLRSAQDAVKKVHCSDEINAFVTELIRETRECEDIIGGVSVRGGIQLIAAAKAHAFLSERDYVTPEDVHAVAKHVIPHRLLLQDRTPDIERKTSKFLEIFNEIKALK